MLYFYLYRDQLTNGGIGQPSKKRSRWDPHMLDAAGMQGPRGPLGFGQSPFNNRGINMRGPRGTPRGGFGGRGQNRFPSHSRYMPDRRSWSRSRSRSRSWSRSRSRSRSRSYSRSPSLDRRRKRWTPERRRRRYSSRYMHWLNHITASHYSNRWLFFFF